MSSTDGLKETAPVTPPSFTNPNPNVAGQNSAFVPDTNGDVGPNHYVQMVNFFFQIFDKQGNALTNPTAFNSLWANVPTQPNCQNNNNGDPIVLYDHLADRWVLLQFALPGGFAIPNFMCARSLKLRTRPVIGISMNSSKIIPMITPNWQCGRTATI